MVDLSVAVVSTARTMNTSRPTIVPMVSGRYVCCCSEAFDVVSVSAVVEIHTQDFIHLTKHGHISQSTSKA